MTGAKTRGKDRDYTRGTQAGGDLNQKRIDSERISAQIAAFEKGGGRVEKLGTTRVLQRVDSTEPAPTVSKPKASGKRAR